MPRDDAPGSGAAIDRSTLTARVAEIVSAYVANNSVPAAELSELIRTVAAALQGSTKAEEEPQVTSAVPVRRSVMPEHIVCLVCGARQKILKRHLATAHAMSPDAYRRQFGLGREYPMVAPAYARSRSEMAKRIGLGRKPAVQTEPAPEPPAPAPKRRSRKKAPAA